MLEEKKIMNGRFKGLAIKRNNFILTSIFFANDALFMGETNSGNYAAVYK